MTGSFDFIPFNYYSGFMNMAIDEVLLNKRIVNEIPNTVRFYGWKPSTASIGVHQELAAEINIEETISHDFQFVRRITGGGAVFHAYQSELTYAIVMQVSDLQSSPTVDDSFIEILQGIVLGLKEIGLELHHDRIHCPSLFTHDQKKISGNAQCRQHGVLLQHGTILLDYDPELMYTILRVKEGRTKSRMVKSVYQHVTTVKEQLGKNYSPEDLCSYVVSGFSKLFKTSIAWHDLRDDEVKAAEALVTTKYATKEWNNRL